MAKRTVDCEHCRGLGFRVLDDGADDNATLPTRGGSVVAARHAEMAQMAKSRAAILPPHIAKALNDREAINAELDRLCEEERARVGDHSRYAKAHAAARLRGSDPRYQALVAKYSALNPDPLP